MLHQIRITLNKLLFHCRSQIISERSKFNLDLYSQNEKTLKPLYLNIGCGKFFHPLWHGLDYDNDYYKPDSLDFNIDLNEIRELPIESNSLEIIYCSHVIEHLTDATLEVLFSEIYRILKKGGLCRVICPNADLYYRAYQLNDSSFWKYPNAYGIKYSSIHMAFVDFFASVLTPEHPFTKCEKATQKQITDKFSTLSQNAFFDYFKQMIPDNAEYSGKFPADHINWFTSKKLIELISRFGFTSVYQSGFLQSASGKMRNFLLFDNTVPEYSLYLESVK